MSKQSSDSPALDLVLGIICLSGPAFVFFGLTQNLEWRGIPVDWLLVFGILPGGYFLWQGVRRLF